VPGNFQMYICKNYWATKPRCSDITP